MAYFDKADFYIKLQSIKTVYTIKNHLFNGYAVDFNERGQAILLGQYKKGIRYGEWLMPSGNVIYYGERPWYIGIPGCGIDHKKNIDQFKNLYAMFIASGNIELKD